MFNMHTQEDDPSNDEWSAYKLDLTDCVDADSFEDNDDMFHSVHPSLFDAHNQLKDGNRKRVRISPMTVICFPTQTVRLSQVR